MLFSSFKELFTQSYVLVVQKRNDMPDSMLLNLSHPSPKHSSESACVCTLLSGSHWQSPCDKLIFLNFWILTKRNWRYMRAHSLYQTASTTLCSSVSKLPDRMCWWNWYLIRTTDPLAVKLKHRGKVLQSFAENKFLCVLKWTHTLFCV